jgi:hypothetical protein
MATQTKQSEQTPAAAPTTDASYWCNFCDFRTNDLQGYLSHSCQDVLANRGVEVKPTGRNECS